MFKSLKYRAEADELMDDYSMGGTELREALRHLRVLNRIFNASGPTLYGVQRLWKEAGKPKRLSILDIGAGSGDVNQRLLRWASVNGVDLTITLADITEEACEEARLLYANEPRIQVMRCDLYELPNGGVDIITGTQFLHHFNGEELFKAVECMLRASRLGVVINDIHRHWIPWTAVWITAHVISGNRYIRNDAPLSVAKGFRAGDWEALKGVLGVHALCYSWRPLFRYAVVIGNKK